MDAAPNLASPPEVPQPNQSQPTIELEVRSKPSRLPWLVTFMVMALAGFGIFMQDREQRQLVEDLATLEAESAHTRDRAQASEAAAASARESDQRSRQQLAALQASLSEQRNEMQQDVDQLRVQLDERNTVAQRLEGLLSASEGRLQEQNGRVTLELVNRMMFRVGDASLTRGGQAMLRRVASALREMPEQQVWVQGHTDNTPINEGSQFPSNWELSAARAASVVHYLQDVESIEPDRLAVVGFGEYRPISRTRARNRRIEIVLFPRTRIVPADLAD